MIFLRYESFREYVRSYPVTVVLLALNIIMFIVVTLSNLPHHLALIKYGAITNHNFISYQPPELHTYVTSIFLHNGFRHLLFNSFSIFVFAPPLERMLGHIRYALLFLLSGIAGNILSEVMYSHVLNEAYFSVGASGAVYGIFGAYLYLILFRKHTLDYNSRRTVVMILVIGAIFSLLVPNINWYAHFGGLIGGLLLTGLFIQLRKR